MDDRSLPLSRPLILLALFLFGCGSAPGTADLRFRSAETNKLFGEHFTRAYYSQADDGDRTIVLINDGLPAQRSSNGPLQPLRTIPLQQIVSMRILWNPLHGTQIDAPSTTNCVMDWVVQGTGPESSKDSLHYQGAGFVTTANKNAGLVVTIRSATMEAATKTGDLTDPIGQCVLTGKFTAIRNDDQVAATTAMIKELPLTEAIPAPAPPTVSTAQTASLVQPPSVPPVRIPAP